MSNIELCADFVRMEEELGLFHEKVDGVAFWEHVRFYIFLELQRSLGLADIEPFQQPKPLGRWARQSLASLAGLVFHNPYFTTQKSLFFFGCPRRTPDEHGVWWDTTVDPFLDSLAESAFYIERYCGGRHWIPTRTKTVKYHDLFSLLACGYRLATSFRRLGDTTCKRLLRIQVELGNRFGVNIDVPGITEPILKTRQALLWPYQKLLERVRPRTVFVASINYYERIAIEVCKKLGIPVVELQHGVIGPFDLCYVYPKGVPLNCFPDYLFVYGPYWKTCLDFPIQAERVIPVGNPYLEARLQEHRQAPKVDQVVVVSQPPVGAALSRFAVELKQRSDFKWPIVYRLHPYEKDWRSRYPWLQGKGITVSDTQDGNIHALLARSRMQIGVYSAALVEGLSFGLSTYLVNLPGVEYLQPMVDRNWAKLISAPAEVMTDGGVDASRADEVFVAPIVCSASDNR